jgi:hypothetical protein
LADQSLEIGIDLLFEGLVFPHDGRQSDRLALARLNVSAHLRANLRHGEDSIRGEPALEADGDRS